MMQTVPTQSQVR